MKPRHYRSHPSRALAQHSLLPTQHWGVAGFETSHCQRGFAFRTADILAAISSRDQGVRQVEPLYMPSFVGDGDHCGDSLSDLGIATLNHGAESLAIRPRISKTIQIDTTRSSTEYFRATI